ncbi:MAG: sulfate adenylyltransferase, partial [Thermodesulfobacteriota bacterium]
MSDIIQPHGGKLVNRLLQGKAREEALLKARSLKSINVSSRIISDIELIAVGAFSPIEGFMGKEDYDSVIENMRLKDGLPWTIPITLPVSEEEAADLEEGEELSLVDQDGNIIAILILEEKYLYDKEREAKNVYGTSDLAHPGVSVLYSQGSVLLGGKISLINRPQNVEFPRYA